MSDKFEKEAKLATEQEALFKSAAEVTERVLGSLVVEGMEIADIGCNDGVLEKYIDDQGHKCSIHCVDVNGEALKTLSDRGLKNVSVKTYEKDAMSFLKETQDNSFDLIITNNALHEITESSRQGKDLDSFLGTAVKKLKEGGRMMIADHYYAPNLTDDEVEVYREKLLREIHHADPRENFVQPEVMLAALKRNGLNMVDSGDVRSTPDIDNRYHYFVVQK